MIRALTAVDAVDMAALHALSFEKGWPETEMAEHAEKDVALGVFEDDRLSGFILIRCLTDQSEILTITVDPNFRRGGVGEKLLSAGEVAAQQAGGTVIFLEVAEDNTAAIALYGKAGYEGFGRRPAYYKRAGGRVAARLFQKKL